MILDAGLSVKAMKMIRLTREQAEGFYAVHSARPFFKDLVEYMISGPVVVSCLEGDNAIARYRDLMGATDPAKAAEGTIRKNFGKSIEANACHGSDCPDTAKVEVAYFFSSLEIVG
ncbi:MAG: nucleoside-diphosphate kinase, partial [Humidesulfovibrio sp.]|nr:nucleoside-diphosphate kinase [Humidesulfovibrio sp.]